MAYTFLFKANVFGINKLRFLSLCKWDSVRNLRILLDKYQGVEIENWPPICFVAVCKIENNKISHDNF